MLSDVILYSNGMIMAFDEGGKQLPHFQDRFCNVWPKIREDYKKTAAEGGFVLFCIADWNCGKVQTSFEALDRFYEDQLSKVG